MNFFKRGAAVLLLICVLFPIGSINAKSLGKDSSISSISASSACLIEAESGKVLYGKSPDRRLPMASTTKIMTAIVALESGVSVDSVLTVPRSAVGTEGSSAYLREGERITLESLLYCLLLSSANDAALAIAVCLCGTVEAFVEKMNGKAYELGLEDTHFENPHGLQADGHYTTARDLANLLAYAVKNEDFLRISGSYRAVISRDGGITSTLVNHNRLLRTYDGIIAGKTGYTRTSGRCLATCAERGGVRLIAVTLNAPSDWSDHARLYDFGFSAYERIYFDGICTDIPVISGVVASVSACSEPVSAVASRDRGNIECVIEAPRFIFAPIGAGECVGCVKYVLNGSVIAESPLIATEGVESESGKFDFFEWLKDLIKEFREWIK